MAFTLMMPIYGLWICKLLFTVLTPLTCRATWDSAVERGQEYVEGGKQAFRKAGRAAREFVDETTQTAEKTADEVMSRRS